MHAIVNQKKQGALLSMREMCLPQGSYWTPKIIDEEGDVDGATVEGWHGACPLCIDS